MIQYLLMVVLYNQLIMKKEDYQSHNNSSPIDLAFIPQALEVNFQEKIKLQIAFYRASKVCKTNPLKFSKSNQHQNRITLQQQKLPFCTTINFNPLNRTFQSKIISVQLALQADGQKQTLDSKLDLKDILNFQSSFEKTGLIVQFKNGIKLLYGISAKIANIKSNSSQQAAPPLKNSNDKSPEAKKEQVWPVKQNMDKKQRVVNQKQIIEKQNDEHAWNNLNQNQVGKNAKLQKSDRQRELELELQTWKTKIKSLEQKISEGYKRTKILQEQNSKLMAKIKQLESSVELRQRELAEKQKFIHKLTEERNNLLKNASKNNQQEQVVNKKNHQIQKMNHQISTLRESNNQLKNKIQQIKRGQLEIRNKYQESEKKNLLLISQISQAQYKCQKIQRENQKYVKKIEKLEEQLNGDSMIQNKKNGNESQLLKQKDQQIMKLVKLGETKEEIIKMLKKENESKKKQLEEDLKNLQKHNKELREEIEKQKHTKKDENNLQLKLQYQKAKKQCAEAKREEKKMLNERADIESKNKQMHKQIMTLKQKIGKILNIVQEQGSSDLFTQVVDCVS